MKQYIIKRLLGGIVLGLIGPIIVLFGIHLFQFSQYSFYDFLENAYQIHVLSIFLSLAAILNLGTFMLLLHFNKDYIARGVIISTFLIGAAIVLLRFNYL